MGCSQGLTRIFVFVANFAFLLVGVALLAVGIFYKINLTEATNAIPNEYDNLKNIPIFSIIVGAIIFFIAFLGCCGACRSNTCMLSWYGAILIIIFLAQVALGIWALLQIKDKEDLQKDIKNSVQILVENYYDNNKGKKEVVNFLQSNFKCCGTDSPQDYIRNGHKIPESCENFTDGCAEKFYKFVNSSMKNIGLVAIIVSAVEVVGAILALCLAGCIRNSKNRDSYY